MHPVEIEQALNTLTILVDTREQPTQSYYRRLKAIGVPFERKKLNFGDYSAKCTLSNGEEYTLENKVSVERKMSFDEICNCYCQGRKRFTREFERAREANAKVYLLVENASWEDAFRGQYRSRMTPQALVASITAWLARYNCQIIFCKPQTTGKLVKELLYREMKERLLQKSGDMDG